MSRQDQRELEHDARKLVDQYRDETDMWDDEIAVVLDAIRAELELENYQTAYGHTDSTSYTEDCNHE